MIKVSIVIPVYNNEREISRCLDAVCRQTLREFQCIVVDDGSTDNSLHIIREYAENDSRIIAISQANRGPSAARNLGIGIAGGKFVAFVDADDEMTDDYLQSLYEAAVRKKADMAACNFTFAGPMFMNNSAALSGIFDGFINIKAIGFLRYYREYVSPNACGYAVWNKLFSMRILREKKLRFNEKMRQSEDYVFNLEYAYYANGIAVLKDSKYNYFIRTDSLYNSRTRRDSLESELYKVSALKEFVFANEIPEFDSVLKEILARACNTARTEGGFTDEKINEIIRETGVDIPYLQEV